MKKVNETAMHSNGSVDIARTGVRELYDLVRYVTRSRTLKKLKECKDDTRRGSVDFQIFLTVKGYAGFSYAV